MYFIHFKWNESHTHEHTNSRCNKLWTILTSHHRKFAFWQIANEHTHERSRPTFKNRSKTWSAHTSLWARTRALITNSHRHIYVNYLHQTQKHTLCATLKHKNKHTRARQMWRTRNDKFNRKIALAQVVCWRPTKQAVELLCATLRVWWAVWRRRERS